MPIVLKTHLFTFFFQVEESINRKLEQLSVAELERLSSGQQQALKMQKQQMLTKEDRLKVLMNQFHRHEQKLDNLRHIRSCLQSQESRLRDLHQMKLQLDRQTASKNQLSKDFSPSWFELLRTGVARTVFALLIRTFSTSLSCRLVRNGWQRCVSVNCRYLGQMEGFVLKTSADNV